MIYLLYGPDELVRTEALAKLKAGVPADLADLNMATLDGRRLKLDALIAACEALPFLADRRMVIVHDLLDDSRYQVADYGASKRLGLGEVIVGHLVPADTAPGAPAPTYYLAGAAAQLTDDTAPRLLEFAELHLADLRRSQPDAEILLRVDERVPYGRVVALIGMAQAAGLSRIGFVAEPAPPGPPVR